MKKKGFTLIEVLGVVLILGMITLITVPNIITRLQNKKEEVSSLARQLLFDATELYLRDYTNKYGFSNGNVYCISLDELVANNRLTEPIVDTETGNTIPLTTVIKVSIQDGKYVYDYNSSECQSHGTNDSKTNGIYLQLKEKTTRSITVETKTNNPNVEVSKYEFQINNGIWIDNGKNAVYTFLNLKTGTYLIRTRTTTTSGEEKISNILTVELPKVPQPTFVVVPDENTWTSQKNVIINYDPNYTTQYSKNGTSFLDIPANRTIEFLDKGSLTVFSSDGINQSNNTINLLKIDVQEPFVKNVTVKINRTLATVTVTADDYNESGVVAYCMVTQNDKNECAKNSNWKTATTNQYVFENKSLGTYYIFIKDAVGNISAGKQVEATEKIKPVISKFGYAINNSKVTLKIEATDEGGSGVAAYCLLTVNDYKKCVWKESTAGSYSYPNQNLGTYYAFVKDAAGNISNSKTTNAVLSSKNFAYTQRIDSYKISVDGYYKLEVWGAQGGGSSGGKGGYSVGYKYLTSGTTIYVGVGGAGNANQTGGYNGGGKGGDKFYVACHGYTAGRSGGGGGGATHIATANGLLSDLKNNKGSVLIVAGGGGGMLGSGAYGNHFAGGEEAAGGYGGGQTGGDGVNPDGRDYARGATQTSGYEFGQGQQGAYAAFGSSSYLWCYEEHGGYYVGINLYSATRNGKGGGGGGYWGGYALGVGNFDPGYGYGSGGGGGSGYIGGVTNYNSYKAQMIAGNASMPNTAGTGNETGHAGNGYAKVTLMGTI